jgi:hypothetical protein
MSTVYSESSGLEITTGEAGQRACFFVQEFE